MRAATVINPLGNQLLFYSMRAVEALGQPYTYTLELLSESDQIDYSSLLGQSMTVVMRLDPPKPIASVAMLERVQSMFDPDEGPVREFSGIVTSFEQAGQRGRYARYRAVLRPWLWLLSYNKNSRIHRGTTRDIILELFREQGFADFKDLLSGEHRRWEYLVQYRESDLNFVSRLMEQEGIYYFFRHKDGKQTMVLADSQSAHEPFPGYDKVPYYPPLESERRERDHINGWHSAQHLRPGTFAVRDYDYKKPTAKLEDVRYAPDQRGRRESEVFEYPGGFFEPGEADVQVRQRLEEDQVMYEGGYAWGNARGLLVGSLFTLTGYPRADQNREYLITSSRYQLRVTDYESLGSDNEGADFNCSFAALQSEQPFRKTRETEKPIVQGPQTAVVVGSKDQEIYTDEYGRVIVQFHWDRLGERNERSSCPVRVSQVSAGSGFGSMHVPRIGEEVIVDFLEGDPDRPIITGRVYNAHNRPPWELPKNQTQSGIKTRSTKDGTSDNYNEIRFEDSKGNEELYIQAERNHTTLVKNDQSTTVQASRSASITGSDSVSVGGDRSLSVSGNLSVSVSGGGKGSPHSALNVTGKHAVTASDTIEASAPTHVELKCGGSSIKLEPGKITISAGGGAALVLTSNADMSSKGGASIALDANAFMQGSGGGSALLDENVLTQSSTGAKVLLDANVLNESSGGAQMLLNTDAKLKGLKSTLEGTASAELNCSGNVKADPTGVTIMGTMVKVN